MELVYVLGFLVICCCHSVDAQKLALGLLPRKQVKSLCSQCVLIA